MKKLLVLVSLILGLYFVLPAQVYSEKQIKKIAKVKTKEIKRNKEEITGTSLPLEYAVKRHLELRYNKGLKEVEVKTNNCPSMNLCSRKALLDAASEYASLTNTHITGQATSNYAFDASKDKLSEQKVKEDMEADYVQRVSADIGGLLEKSYATYRKKGGLYHFSTFYLIDEEKVKKAKIQAMKAMLIENGVSGNDLDEAINSIYIE